MSMLMLGIAIWLAPYCENYKGLNLCKGFYGKQGLI